MGVAEVFVTGYLSPYRDAIAFVLLIVILLVPGRHLRGGLGKGVMMRRIVPPVLGARRAWRG